MVTRWGGFVGNADMFDAAFFGIAPREATRMDPQQRWLAEVTWEAMEDAGLPPEQLAGTRTGVFLGISACDYFNLLRQETHLFDGYSNIGNALCIAANRLSFLFDLRGPSFAVDTACSLLARRASPRSPKSLVRRMRLRRPGGRERIAQSGIEHRIQPGAHALAARPFPRV
jgi:acyl transferase domain-containing protein